MKSGVGYIFIDTNANFEIKLWSDKTQVLNAVYQGKTLLEIKDDLPCGLGKHIEKLLDTLGFNDCRIESYFYDDELIKVKVSRVLK